MDSKKERGTIYQQLNKLFNFDGFGFDNTEISNSDKNPKIIIKGASPTDVHRKGLEIAQKKELQNKFFRTTERGFQKALQYEAARLPAYLDYEGMEYYPIISSALDLFMEEATTIGINGKMLNIYSNKERIKLILDEFFYDIVNVNVNLPFWVRNLVKYGDNFVLLYGERKHGISHIKQLVNYDIERFDRIQNNKPIVKFKERTTGDEFNIFEIAHFRLLGDDKYLPYGSCLLSDSYIKTQSGIKEIKDIVKGDIVTGFDIKTQKLIKSNVLDVVCNGEKEVYRVSTSHNYIKATDNHKILIYDYKDNKFKYEFVSELMIGDGLVINKSDDYSEKIEINKKNEIKEYNGRIYNAFTDDLKYIPEYVDEDFARMFGFLLGDGGINSKRPYMVYFAYGVHETINKKYIELLEKFSGKEIYLRKNKSYNNGIASAVVNSKSLATVLLNMGFDGNARNKRIPKWVYSTSKEIRKAFLEGIIDADGCVNVDKWNCRRFQIELSNYSLINDIKLLAQSLGYKTGNINKRKPRKKDVLINGNKIINIADSYILYFYESENTQTKSSDIESRKTNDFIVEKIKSIKPDGKGFVYDIHVDNENHNFFANNIVVHNSVLNKVRRVFRQLVMAEDAMLTYRIIRAGEKKVFKIDVGNMDDNDVEDYMYKVATKFKKMTRVNPNDGQIDYSFNILGNDEDYFLPVRNSNVQTGIETLPGASNLDQIQDIEYLRDNLFVGLGIPKPFLSFQDAAGAGKNMAQYDIRFAKKINRIQQAIIQELNKMAIIHLYLMGYSGDDLNSFTLTLTNPSTQQELLKSELLRDKAQTYSELTRGENGIAAMSHTNAKRKIWNMSDSEIVEDLKQQKLERVIMQELQDASVLIKKTGLFADIDKKFGEPMDNLPPTSSNTENMSMGGNDMSGMDMGGGNMGGMDMGGGNMPMGGNDMGGMNMMENKYDKNLFEKYVNNLVYGDEKNEKNNNIKKKIIAENTKLNNNLNLKAKNMIEEINVFLDKQEEIIDNNDDDILNVNIDNIELLE